MIRRCDVVVNSLRRLRCGFLTIAATVTALLAWPATASAEEYFMPLPADLGHEWSMCTFRISALDRGFRAAVGAFDLDERLKSGETYIARGGYELTWNADQPSPGIRVSTKYKNKFWMDAGFCRHSDDGEQFLTRSIDGFMTGGSEYEADVEGPYDTPLSVGLKLCGVEEDLEFADGLKAAIEDAVSGDPDAAVEFREFDATGADLDTFVHFDVISYERSHRTIADQIMAAIPDEYQAKIIYGNRMLAIAGCEGAGLWYRVLDEDGKTLWSDSFSGYRVAAAAQRDGNILVTYTVSANTVLVNIFGVKMPGPAVIGPAPEAGAEDPFKRTFVSISRADGMEVTGLITSLGGSMWLVENAEEQTLTGAFQFMGVDHEGKRRTVVGGFRNVKRY